ncbi:hypothetical protein AMELA_G00136070 [Ameiurus melas]|uniref:Uncharacterized protein n=1 Tax=Ameiurus melas TaxID=219545 RepID=A0A7J6AJJ1_AMEME|nr:hypothetical protein AMELA_G00136070 [Ameiurus melas]
MTLKKNHNMKNNAWGPRAQLSSIEPPVLFTNAPERTAAPECMWVQISDQPRKEAQCAHIQPPHHGCSKRTARTLHPGA